MFLNLPTVEVKKANIVDRSSRQLITQISFLGKFLKSFSRRSVTVALP